MKNLARQPDSNILFSLLAGVHLSALPLYTGMPLEEFGEYDTELELSGFKFP